MRVNRWFLKFRSWESTVPTLDNVWFSLIILQYKCIENSIRLWSISGLFLLTLISHFKFSFLSLSPIALRGTIKWQLGRTKAWNRHNYLFAIVKEKVGLWTYQENLQNGMAAGLWKIYPNICRNVFWLPPYRDIKIIFFYWRIYYHYILY